MTNIDLMNYWITSADEDYEVMYDLYKNKRNSYCLFFGQLVIEKLLKALYAKNNVSAPHAPKSHDLPYLAEKAELDLDDEKENLLGIITGFNMSARYDDYNLEFHSKCTNEYTAEQLKNIEEIRTWLKEELKTNQS